MENNNIPYIVYESSLAREERQQKRLVVVIVILIILLFITNAVWVYFWNQYDYSVDVKSDEGGIANYIGNDGDINNGTNNSTQDKDSGAS